MSRSLCLCVGKSLVSSFILDTLRSCASMRPASESRDFLSADKFSSFERISLKRRLSQGVRVSSLNLAG